MKVWKGDHRPWAQAKFDGHYTEMSCGRALTRGGTDITEKIAAIPHLSRFLEMPGWIAELWVPGEPASFIKTALNSRDPRLRLSIHASQLFKPEEDLSTLAEFYGDDFITPFRWMHLDEPQKLIDQIMAEYRCEGVVFKQSNLLGWEKYKPTKTIDLVVVDTTDGDGKFLGLLGSLVCALADGRIVANVSGMTDGERVMMTLESPIGKVVEVEYQYVGAGGRLRHPVFKRFRDDKQPCECTADQDDKL